MGANQSRDQADSRQEKKVAVEEIFVQKIAYKCGVTEQAEIQPGFVASERLLPCIEATYHYAIKNQ